MPYQSPIISQDPITLNDVRVVEEEMDSRAIDSTNPEWTQAIQFVLSHQLMRGVQAGGSLTSEDEMRLIGEIGTKFELDAEESLQILEDAQMILEDQQSPVDQGPSEPPIGTPPAEATAAKGPTVLEFKVDFSKEFDEEQDIVDDISAKYGLYKKDWDFTEGDAWEVSDRGTVSIKILKGTAQGSEYAEAAPAPQQSQQAPAETAKAPSFDEMAQHRISLQKKMDDIADQINQLQTALEGTIAKERDMVQQEEPALMEMLEKLPKYQAIIDGWKVSLSKRKESERVKYKDILEYVEKKSETIAPNIAKLIAQLRGMDKYLTKIPESKSVDVQRQESSLHTEAGWKETWNKLKQWVSSVFSPLASQIDSSFDELEGYLAADQQQ